MSVQVTPREYIGFRRPFNKAVTSHLKLYNPHHTPIVVKIKVTSPKAYCVRPNSSRIDPGETLDVAVILSAMKEQPPPHAKCTDKFLVCSALIPVEKERMALSEFWHELESTNKAAIKEHRLKSVYLSDTETIPEDSAGDVTRYDDATNGTVDSPLATPHKSAAAAPSREQPQALSPPIATGSGVHVTNIHNSFPQSSSNEPQPAPISAITAAAGSVPSAQITPAIAAPTTSTPAKPSERNAAPEDPLLTEARAQVKELQQKLTQSEMKIKTAIKSVAPETVEGYQLTVVIAVAVAAFSIGYLWKTMS